MDKTYATSREAKQDKCFSRRHRTNQAQEETRNRRADKLAKKLQDSEDRIAVSDIRKPSEQLKRLDRRLGKGVGAAKERAKLARRIKDGDLSRDKIEEKKEEKE